MASTLSQNLLTHLQKMGFAFVKVDRFTQREQWLSQDALPHLLIQLDPKEHCTLADILRAVYSAGAADAREETRTQYKRFLQTFGASTAEADLPAFLLDPPPPESSCS